MKTYKKYILIYFVFFPILFIPMVISADFVLFNKDELADIIVHDMNNGGYDILFFGDSVIHAVGQCDRGGAGIDLLLNRKIDNSMLTVQHNGYSPVMYREYARLLSIVKNKPKLVIVPVNLASFSDGWYKRPDFNFPLKRLYIEYLYSGKIDVRKYAQYRFFKKSEKDATLWKEEAVVYGENNLGKLGHILKKSSIGGNRLALECLKGDYGNIFGYQLSLQFQFNYMNLVNSDHPMLVALKETIENLKNNGIEVLVYLTPVNVEDGVRYLGPPFKNRVAKSVDAIKKILEQSGVHYLDMTFLLDGKRFTGKSYSSAHLDIYGRTFVSERLAEYIRGNGLLNGLNN